MTVPASNAVVIFIIASHVRRAITMAGCRVHSTAIPRNKIAASASIGGEAVVSDIELAWLRECQQTGRFPLRKWHRYGPNDHFDRGLKPASLLQHEMLADGRGRDEDCSSPPAQIPACAANAPGSSLGSNVGGKWVEPICGPAHSRQSDRRGYSALRPNHGRLSAVSLG
jgi:hypothetical protein